MRNLTRVTEENKPKIINAINSIILDKGTNIFQGMLNAFLVLLSRNQINHVTSIFLLSDGQDDEAYSMLKGKMTRYWTPTHPLPSIHTFGFGKSSDSIVMKNIASLADGNYYFIQQLS